MSIRNGHRVFVAAPIHPAAVERLRAFFRVEVAPGLPEVSCLQATAGVVADERMVFDARLIEQLPALQAVSVAGARSDQLDLPALTRAGIRATNTPLDADALIAEAIWSDLERELRLMGPSVTPPPGRPVSMRPGGRLGRPLRGLAIAIPGRTLLDFMLAARATRAGVRVVDCRDQAIDVVVVTDHSSEMPAGVASVRSIDLSSVVRDLRTGDALAATRDRIAAEGLIASLGFGRDGFHPPYLLNPEIACTSCC